MMSIKPLCLFLIFGLAASRQIPQGQQPFPSDSYSFAIDIADNSTLSAFQCLYQQGYNAVFIQIYSPLKGGSVNPGGPASIQNAYTAKLGSEIYVTPIPSKSATNQFTQIYNALRKYGFSVRTMWLQVSSFSGAWSTTPKKNVEFINSFITKAASNGISVGIYTNFLDWQQITNNNASFSSNRLWYYNAYGQGTSGESPANFNDFRAFAGWSQPSVKQFALNETFCGLYVNRDVYPAGSKAVGRSQPLKEDGKIVIGGYL